jgi:adenylate cyclase
VAPAASDRKLAAILSADIVGYTRLMAEDEQGTIRTLGTYREEIGVLVRDHRGRVVDFAGDNFLAEFPTALEAVQAAVEVQRVLGVRNAELPADRRMEFRMGLHLGDVAVEGDRIYGDGVNIAARLEGLAEPGGICVSGEVHGQVRQKLQLGYEDLGEQELKGVSQLVRVYRVQLQSEAPSVVQDLPGMDELTVPGFSGRPAIAVLAFDNLSGDPEQEYFADGISEDLITRLSAWKEFPVIARNSSFAYKGRPVDVKTVSRELGVRYVVEGSVRRAGSRVRISAQLIDATTGAHIWARRYDRELEDVFQVQDEITDEIARSMHPELSRSEQERVVRVDPQNLDAWECTQRATWHWGRRTKEDNERARWFCNRAIELDPFLVNAFYGLAWTHYLDYAYQWTDSPFETIRKLEEAARRCVALDDASALGKLALGLAYRFTTHPEKALASLERSIQLNPSLADGYIYLGVMLADRGQPDPALEMLERGMRLSPQDPSMSRFFHCIALAHFVAERYEEALQWDQRSIQQGPSLLFAHLLMAATHAHLGQLDEARSALVEVQRVSPGYSLSGLRLFFSAVDSDPEFSSRFEGGLRKAGLPEE